MHNANVFDKEEKLALTKVVKMLKTAQSTAFTVCYTCKIDEKQIKEKFSALSEIEYADLKTVAKNILIGKESIVTGRLSSTEGKLGRSLVHGLQYAK